MCLDLKPEMADKDLNSTAIKPSYDKLSLCPPKLKVKHLSKFNLFRAANFKFIKFHTVVIIKLTGN